MMRRLSGFFSSFSNPHLFFSAVLLALLSAFFLSVVASKMENRKIFMETAAVRSQTQARMLAEHASDLFRMIDLSLLSILSSLETMENPASREVAVRIRQRALFLHQLKDIRLLDAEGRLLHAEQGEAVMAAGDVRYFMGVHRDAMMDFDISAGRHAEGEKPEIRFSRRVEDREGRFRGVLVAFVDFGYFRERYREYEPAGLNATVLYDEAGRVLTGWPVPDDPYRRLTHVSERPYLKVFDPSDLTAGGMRTLENAAILVAVCQLPDFPFHLALVLDKEEALAGWKRDMGFIYLLFGISFLGLLLMTRGVHSQAERRRGAEMRALAFKAKSELTSLLREIALLTQDADTLSDAVEAFLGRVCAYAGWRAGILRMWLSEEERLEVFSFCPSVGQEDGRWAAFCAGAAKADIGDPAVKGGAAFFSQDGPASAEKALFFGGEDCPARGVCLLPVSRSAHVKATALFFSGSPEEKEEQLLDIMAQAASLAGRVIERRAAESRLAASLAMHKEMQRELAKAKARAEAASEAKSAFLTHMSHELRTPMNGVRGMADLLSDTGLDAEQKNYVRIIQTSCDSLLGIINSLLDLARIEAGQVSLERIGFGLRSFLEAFAAPMGLMAGKKGLDFVWEVAEDAPEDLLGDPEKLGRILTNLVGNALKFTHKGGIAIRVRRVREENCRVVLHFAVADTGIGISAEKISRLFRPFSQADASISRIYGGTGLGLALARELAGKMGGEMGVESETGAGSTFWFTVALEKPDVPSSAMEQEGWRSRSPESLIRPEQKKGRVLVVEDSATSQQVALGFLSRLGIDADLAAHGGEALEMLADRPYDLVLMDVQMPEMDGLEATRRLRGGEGGENREVPVIAMTASAMREDQEDCLRAGMTACLTKPLSGHDLAEILAAWLPEKARSASGLAS